MRFFFYGTLMDRDLVSLVLRRPIQADRFRPAILRDHERRAIAGETFPAIARVRGGSVEGVVVDGFTAADFAKLSAYEGASFTVTAGTAEIVGVGPRGVRIFVIKPGVYRLADTDWDVEAWRRDHKTATLDAIRRAAARD